MAAQDCPAPCPYSARACRRKRDIVSTPYGISSGRTIRSLVGHNWRNSLAATVNPVTDGAQIRHFVMAVTGPRGGILFR
jgi:hypothetical protein